MKDVFENISKKAKILSVKMSNYIVSSRAKHRGSAFFWIPTLQIKPLTL